jgi:hypothetical protein
MVNEKITSGVRLKDMPEEWFTQPDDEDLRNPIIAAVAVLGCNRLVDELTLLKRNYHFYEKCVRAPQAHENMVLDIIQRKVRDVILSAPEPEDYEALLDKVAKEFKEGEEG